MEHDFWHERWGNRQIAFHQNEVHPMLVQHFAALSLKPGEPIFVPLCGKTLDIGWLLQRGHPVVAAELSEIAVRELFAELNIEATISPAGALQLWQQGRLSVFVGDIFELQAEQLGHVAAVHDRAALVALPEPMRARYARQVIDLSHGAPQLLISFDYDQSRLAGPPFSVPENEIRQLYGEHYQIRQLAQETVPGQLKRKVDAQEELWLLN